MSKLREVTAKFNEASRWFANLENPTPEDKKKFDRAQFDFAHAGGYGFDRWCHTRNIRGARKEALWQFIFDRYGRWNTDPDAWDLCLTLSGLYM